MGSINEAIQKFTPEEETAIALRNHFEPFEKLAEEWKEKAMAIQVTDAGQTDLIIQAKEGRLFLKNTRVNIDKLHKLLKADSLKKGQLLDMIKRTLNDLIEPLEDHLDKQERFPEIQEGERKLALFKSRIEQLQPFRADNDRIEQLPLGDMPDDQFQTIFLGVKAAWEIREKEKAELEQLRKQQEQNAAAEQQRIIEENQKLKRFNDRVESLSKIGFFPSENSDGKFYTHKGLGLSIRRESVETYHDDDFQKQFKQFTSQVAEFVIRVQRMEKRIARIKATGAVVDGEMQGFSYHKADGTRITIAGIEDSADDLFEIEVISFEREVKRYVDEQKEFAIEKARVEGETRQRLEQLEKDEAERKRLQELQEKEKIAADKKAKRAPDKVKLLGFAERIEALEPIENLKDDDAVEIYNNALASLDKVVKYIKKNAENL